MKKIPVLLLIIASLIAPSFAGIGAPEVRAAGSVISATATPKTINATNVVLTVTFTMDHDLGEGDTIAVSLGGQSVSNGAKSVSVGALSSVAATASGGVITATLAAGQTLPHGTVSLSVLGATGITNPSTAQRVWVFVVTSKDGSLGQASIDIVGGSVMGLNLDVTPKTPSTAASYSLGFTATSGVPTTGTITIQFPYGTTVTGSPSGYLNNGYVQFVGGASVQGTYSVVGYTMTITISSGSIAAGAPVWITISSALGIKTPPSVGTYWLTVQTSTDTTPATAQFQLTGTSVSNLVVTADPKAQSAPTEITLTFTTSPTGGLTAGSGTITVDFPDGMTVPSSIPSGQLTVNGTPAYYVSVGSGGVVTITTPVAIAAYQQVSVVFRKNVGILNPASSGTVVSIAVSTSADVVPVSGSYTTITSQIAQPQVQLTSNGAGSTSGYTVTFTTGAVGSLRAGYDRISLVFPSGTVVPATITKDRVTVNGYAAYAVSVSGSRLDITPSMNVTAGGSVQVVISKDAGIKNPTVATSYTLQAYTSVETTPVTSASYTIVNLPKTLMVVSPAAPDGLNGYYKTRPTVVLSASSATDPSPVVYYTINGGAQQVYTAPIQLPDGTVTLSYFARDRQGNQEDAQTATFKVDATTPTATITSPADGSTVAQSPVTITGKVSPGMQVSVGSQTATVSGTGDFTVNVPLVEGAQTITLTVTSVSGNVGQAQLRLTLDTKPPVLTFTEPKIYSTVMTQQITVSGKTEAGATVTVAGSPVSVGADGSFSVKYMFTKEGLNVIEITATDPAGNGAKAAIPVTYVARTVIRLQVGNKTAMVNDASKTLQAAPVNVKGVVNVPLRFIGEAFGATVEWEPVFKIVRIQLGATTIYLQVGSNYASVNGKKVVLQGVPTIVSGTTMVPIRFISEAFGAEVVWTEATKGITITYPKP